MIYLSKIKKAKFDKDVKIPIPGACKFTVPREDFFTEETEITKVFKQIVRTLNEKEVQNGKRKNGSNDRRGNVSGN